MDRLDVLFLLLVTAVQVYQLVLLYKACKARNRYRQALELSGSPRHWLHRTMSDDRSDFRDLWCADEDGWTEAEKALKED